LRVALNPFLAALAWGVVAGAPPAYGADFRVENSVFLDGEEEPQIRSTTIFHQGVVYDFLGSPGEVTIFDTRRGRFVLLDPTRQIKTELTSDAVGVFAERLRQWSQRQDDPFLEFMASPEFDGSYERETGQLTFTSPWVTYRLETIDSPNAETSRQYREFCDWHCRLNTLLTPGARPPFARMVVNETLERLGRFPREVHLTWKPKHGLLSRSKTARSKHLLVRQLVESDRRRIAQSDMLMATFTAVRFVEYQRKTTD
jgi:hypothetical protein